jgi:hypothetical protein
MHNTTSETKGLIGKFYGRSPVGRPQLRRNNTIRRDSLLLLNIRGWRRLREDRNIWKRTNEEVRALWGLSCYTRRRRNREEKT